MSDEPSERESPSTSDLAARRRIGWIGAALIALGVTRGWADGAALVRDVRQQERWTLALPSTSPWTDYGGIVWGAWPIGLGILLIVRRPRTWLKAAAITAFALGAERAAMLAIGALFDSGWSTLYRGRFDNLQSRLLPRGGWLAVSVAASLAWFAVGLTATREITRSPSPLAAEGARRRHGMRFPSGSSVLFALALLGMATWTTYMHGLERLPWVRALILNGDRPRNRTRAFEPPVVRQLRDAEKFFTDGQGLAAEGKLVEARRALIKGVNRLETTMDENPREIGVRREFAFAANNLAWFLATCEDPSLQDAEAAVTVARKALAVSPKDGNTLNTLAVAHFRAGEFNEASKTFAESMALRDGGDSFDWYFLAQIELSRNHPVEAKALYDKAVAWGAEFRPLDAELYRFRVEAAQRLGLPKPEVPAAGLRARRASPVPLGPNGFRRR